MPMGIQNAQQKHNDSAIPRVIKATDFNRTGQSQGAGGFAYSQMSLEAGEQQQNTQNPGAGGAPVARESA